MQRSRGGGIQLRLSKRLPSVGSIVDRVYERWRTGVFKAIDTLSAGIIGIFIMGLNAQS